MAAMSTDDRQGLEASRAILAHLAANDFPKRSLLYAVIAREAMADDAILELAGGVAPHEPGADG
jgi:hypothetical protein